MSEEILDYDPERPKANRVLSAAFIFSLVLFFYWFVAGIAHWPYGNSALLMGLALLLIVTLIRFFKKSGRAVFEYFYLLGKLMLIAAIYANLTGMVQGFLLIYIAAGFFILGLATLFLRK